MKLYVTSLVCWLDWGDSITLLPSRVYRRLPDAKRDLVRRARLALSEQVQKQTTEEPEWDGRAMRFGSAENGVGGVITEVNMKEDK